VPLKLYSTLQEDFTPAGTDEQDDEGMMVSMMISLFKMFSRSF
jgi:hypothetical protein